MDRGIDGRMRPSDAPRWAVARGGPGRLRFRGGSLAVAALAGAVQLWPLAARADDYGPGSGSVDDAPPYTPPAAPGGGTAVGIGVNPAALLYSAVAFDVQIGVSSHLALMPMGMVYVGGETKGGGGGLGAMIFPMPKRPLHGLYISPRLRYLSASQQFTTFEFNPSSGSSETTTEKATANLASFGSTVGYQFNWGFLLRLGGGLSYAAVTGGAGGAEFDAEGVAFEAEVLVGAAF
ncbi:MAG: hypothetical protein IT376_17760 [Polyangiaceae bacterium]|nr:hypothetical protein [Polyangiaceae bacterium]